MKIYIARSANNHLHLFTTKPIWWAEQGWWMSITEDIQLDANEYPEIKKGECWSAEITAISKIDKEAVY